MAKANGSRRKQRKAAAARKDASKTKGKAPAAEPEDVRGDEDVLGEEGEGILAQIRATQAEMNKRAKKRAKQAKSTAAPAEEDAEASESEDESDEEARALRQIHAERKRQLQSSGSDDEEEDDEEEEVDEEEAERNRQQTLAILERLDDISLNLPFVERLEVIAEKPLQVENAEDDLEREVQFYKQALDAVKIGRSLLDKEGIPHMRPIDYMAEMVKDDEHMARVKQNLLFEKKKIEAFEQRKQQKEYKKYAKKVQAEKLKEKAAKKKRSTELAKEFKAKGGADDLVNSTGRKRQARADIKPNKKREYKNAKYGFGGKKRFKRKNDAESVGSPFVRDKPAGARKDKDDALNLVGVIFGVLAGTAASHYRASRVATGPELKETASGTRPRPTASAAHWAAVSPLDLRFGAHVGVVSRTALGVYRCLVLIYCMWAVYLNERPCCDEMQYFEVWNFVLFTWFFFLAAIVSIRPVHQHGVLRQWEKFLVRLFEVELPTSLFLFCTFWSFDAFKRQVMFPSSQQPVNRMFHSLNAIFIVIEAAANRIVLRSDRWFYFCYLFGTYGIFLICVEKLRDDLVYKAQGFLHLRKSSIPDMLELLMLEFAFHYAGCVLVTARQYFWTTPITAEAQQGLAGHSQSHQVVDLELWAPSAIPPGNTDAGIGITGHLDGNNDVTPSSPPATSTSPSSPLLPPP
ncbi:Probable rRNA-processing protein ebp2 [Durusdinium trenchii]|uniref:Probable rRNA-processing protein ebp2 n=1 Tax=Durusdinium trenchii TaxID=1381693 RepID=A0ABP0J6U7_9DINO